MLSYFEEIALLEAKNPAAEILVPLLKIQITKRATELVREAQMIFGGNGILRDFSILPRLSQDALIQEIWEGTHAVLAGHVVKALKRPSCRAAFESLIAPDRLNSAANSELELCDEVFAALSTALQRRESGR